MNGNIKNSINKKLISKIIIFCLITAGIYSSIGLLISHLGWVQEIKQTRGIIYFFCEYLLLTLFLAASIISLFYFFLGRHIAKFIDFVNKVNIEELRVGEQKIFFEFEESQFEELNLLAVKINDLLQSFTALARKNEKEQSGKQMIQQTKLEAVREIAGGVAHEINNPIAIINGLAERNVRCFETGNLQNKERNIRDLMKIQEMTVRISTIVKGLLYYARESFNEVEENSNIKEIITNSVESCSGKYSRSNIDLIIEIPKDLSISCRSVQVEQIFANLLENAYDEIFHLEGSQWVKFSSKVNTDFYDIKISNSGPKIQSEIADRLFNPFYTNKPIGKGPGLGLSIAKGIAEAHGWDIFVDLDEDFTTFNLRMFK